ncbi:hypothetical protein [Streptomyces glomeratus]|uniref:Uncharacterized protein n=1 Tax=Streptomyces glomeratus TaxID=284452 RepID=A0ABP6LBT2_9ACTN|nr:hypothetical protein [Streptomyces glomeratus]MCF1507030.1 hypothetical protein [Streptomyces glomeratus]
MPASIRPFALALALCGTLIAGVVACGSGGATREVAAYITVPSPSPSTPAQWQRLAKARFAVNAGLAAGAVHQWIVKPWKAGAFSKKAKGRNAALVKAALAGSFAYHRLLAARRNAQGDPALSRAIAPLAPSIDSLKSLPGRLRKGDESAVGSFDAVIRKVKAAGKSAGVPVRPLVPSSPQLARG